jgi:hypothetical protein
MSFESPFNRAFNGAKMKRIGCILRAWRWSKVNVGNWKKRRKKIMQRGEKKNKRERSEKIIGVDNSVACHSNRRSIARVMVQKWGESGVY